jgi:tripartite-type tricarboxylate transporter receptor subunit TctC
MLLVPAKTPKYVIARLHEAIVKSLQLQNLRESYAKMGALPGGNATPQEARAYFVSEVERYAKLVKAIGLKIE